MSARSTDRTSATSFAGALVLCPPSAVDDRWSRRFADPVTAFASGWMRIKGRVRQRGVELPLVISDHADWPELLDTIAETGAEDVWVTHGREDALVYQLGQMGRKARALSLVGFEDEARVGSVKRFADLLDCLTTTPSRNGKLALLVDYFRATPDPDRGFALGALTDGLFRACRCAACSPSSWPTRSTPCSTSCRATTSATRPRPWRCCGRTARPDAVRRASREVVAALELAAAQRRSRPCSATSSTASTCAGAGRC